MARKKQMKKLLIKTGTYTNKQGENKNEYLKLGTIMTGKDGGEFILLDPSISLAGALTKQNMMNHKQNKPVRDSLMVSVFEDTYGQQAPQQQQAPKPQVDDLENSEIPF